MSSSKQGFLRNVKVTPRLFRLGLNLWPPFRGAGIRVTRVTPDYREVDVVLKLKLLNRNDFGTQFGGSLFAMTGPFHALMLFHDLGTGDKHEPTFSVDIVDGADQVIAVVDKTLHVRRQAATA